MAKTSRAERSAAEEAAWIARKKAEWYALDEDERALLRSAAWNRHLELHSARRAASHKNPEEPEASAPVVKSKRVSRYRLWRKINLLFLLVAFVFVILLVSVGLASLVLFLLNHFGLMLPLTESRLPLILGFMLVASLVTALVLTLIFGNLSLKPLRHFVNATKEVASGNFDVRIPPYGPEEMYKLAVSFNEMAEELGSIETLRDDFVHNISHEYKTPIASIKGFAKLLKNEDLSKEQRDEYLDIIIMESNRLAQLSTNVLLLSKLESTDTLENVAEFSLDEQLRRVVLLMDQQIEEKGLDITLDLTPCTVVSNEEMLQQVWINLLSNAIKFTNRGGHITLSLQGEGSGSSNAALDAATVIIGDTGVGMTPEVLERVFDKFYQGDSSRSSEGNGLGLALAHRIVELCNGNISVLSKPDEGSRFTVTLLSRYPS